MNIWDPMNDHTVPISDSVAVSRRQSLLHSEGSWAGLSFVVSSQTIAQNSPLFQSRSRYQQKRVTDGFEQPNCVEHLPVI